MAGAKRAGEMQRGALHKGTKFHGDGPATMQASLKQRLKELQCSQGKQRDKSTEDSVCHLVIISEFPTTRTQCLVSWFAGAPVHSEILLHEPGSMSQMFTYTAFMGESFSMSLLSDELISSRDFADIAIQITKEELQRLQRYVMRLVEREVPYNFKDLPLAAGVAGNGEVLNTIFPDVSDDSVELVKTVYCSQAMILAMRACLDDRLHPELCRDLRTINSRATSPQKLHHIMKKHGKLVHRSSLRDDVLLYEETS